MVNRSEIQIDHIKTSLATLVISVYCVYAIRNKTHINTCDHILCAHRIPKLGLRERVRPACHIIASRPQNKRWPNRPSHRRRRRRQTLSPVVVGPVAVASRWHQPSWRVGCFLIVVYLWFIITHCIRHGTFLSTNSHIYDWFYFARKICRMHARRSGKWLARRGWCARSGLWNATHMLLWLIMPGQLNAINISI